MDHGREERDGKEEDLENEENNKIHKTTTRTTTAGW
jgi:hypothetical protein